MQRFNELSLKMNKLKGLYVNKQEKMKKLG